MMIKLAVAVMALFLWLSLGCEMMAFVVYSIPGMWVYGGLSVLFAALLKLFMWAGSNGP